jgi:hypothetical protein
MVGVMLTDQTVGDTVGFVPQELDRFGGYGIGNWVQDYNRRNRPTARGRGDMVENFSPGAFGTHPWLNRDTRTYGVFLIDAENAGVCSIVESIRDAVRSPRR